jgi:hypothetical protein
MGNLCISIHFTSNCTTCIAFMLVTHTCTFVIDHVEPGPVEPPEPAPVETVNYEQDQGKPGVSNRNPSIYFILHLSYL